MTKEELLEAYENGERDFSGKDFSGIDLGTINVAKANFSNCNFTEADLFGAIFSDSNLTNANFTNANLNYTDFSRAILINTNFTNINKEEFEPVFDDAIFEEKKERVIEKNITHTKALICFSKGNGSSEIKINAQRILDNRFAKIEIELREADSSNESNIQHHEVIDAENKVALYIHAPQNEIPKEYWNGIKEGAKQIMKELPFPLYNVRIKVISGGYHGIFSNEESFKIATIAAIKDAMQKGKFQFYIPCYSMIVYYNNEEYTAKIVKAANEKNCEINEMNKGKIGFTIIYPNISNLEQKLHDIDASLKYDVKFSHYGDISSEIKLGLEEQLNSFLR